MKKRVSFTPRSIVCAVFCILGLCLAVKYGSEWYRSANARNLFVFEHPMEIGNPGAASLKAGDYYICDIDECIVLDYYANGQAVKSTYLGTLSDYHMYTIPYGYQEYIGIYIKDGINHKLLGDFVLGVGERVTVKAKVVKKANDYDNSYIEHCVQEVNPNGFTTEYVLVETDSKVAINIFFVGIMMIIGSVALIIRDIKVKVQGDELEVEGEERKDGSRYRSYGTDKDKELYISLRRNRANCDVMLESRERYLEKLFEIQARQKNFIIVAVLLIVIGVLFMLFTPQVFGIPGLIIAIYGFSRIIVWFINSDLEPAVRLAKVFSLKTIHVKIVETQHTIDILERIIAEDNRKTEDSKPIVHKSMDTPDDEIELIVHRKKPVDNDDNK